MAGKERNMRVMEEKSYDEELTGNSNITPISVNWHFWPRCNYSCKFCFGKFKHVKRVLPLKMALKVPDLLYAAGAEKLTFSGGEPMLCPYLGELVRKTKKAGLTTMIITNGSRITRQFLDECGHYIDWFGISIDSSSEEVERILGRGTGNHVARAVAAWEMIHEYGIKLKLNTVVTSLTWNEDMGELVERLSPDRWKVFQVLPVKGENDWWIDKLAVSERQFRFFAEKHGNFSPVTENNGMMRGSYVMIDPMGRVFQNTMGKLVHGESILESDAMDAIANAGWAHDTFLQRGGLYNW
jgi:radical S-adenosyl methionine domain-containing protein 2